MTSHIESPQNPRVKEWVALRKRRNRERSGTFFVEGERETLRMAGSLPVATGIVREDRTDVRLPNRVVVSARVFERLSAREHPDGVAAVVTTPDLALDRFAPSTDVILIADRIEKPGNIGAMIRTADGFGAAFMGSDLGTDLVNRNVIRAAQGSLFATETANAGRSDAMPWSKAFGRVLVAVADPAAESIWDTDLSGPVCLVVGREHDGAHPDWQSAGLPVTIPTTGTADSLNASVAAAVLLAEARRQRSV